MDPVTVLVLPWKNQYLFCRDSVEEGEGGMGLIEEEGKDNYIHRESDVCFSLCVMWYPQPGRWRVVPGVMEE